jgi:hypothetical protein
MDTAKSGTYGWFVATAGSATAGAGGSGGGSNEYITGVTSRERSSELRRPPMMTIASGE